MNNTFFLNKFNPAKNVARCRGQSLFEMVLSLGVVMLVIAALVWAATISVRNADFAKKQVQATKYAQEGMESIRAFRDSNWERFWSYAAGGTNYGLAGFEPSGVCPSTPNLGATVFTRCVKLEQEGAQGTDMVKATVTVSWKDSNRTHKSEQVSYFTKW